MFAKCGFFVVSGIRSLCANFYRRPRCREDKALYDSLEVHEVWISDHLPANRVDRILKNKRSLLYNYSSNCNLITDYLDPS
jgi:hypothetical protein